jgi:hypothetical protein
VTDIGTTDDGMVFMVMEYLEGENLEDRLRRVGRLALFDAVNILRQVARGLGAAHELGIVHRDLKPANIFLVSREGRRRVVRRLADPSGDAEVQFKVEPEGNYDVAKLLDFGVAKFLNLGPSAATRAGVVCGTPYYLSPEQAQEQPADARSDIYALGAVFYEMITGVVPFAGKSLLEILTGHVTGVVIPPSQRAPDAGINPQTDAVVLKCLAKSPEERFAGTDDFADALRDCVGDCAFFRDAERLPGIREAGFDLTESRLDPFEANVLSKTRRFRRNRTRGMRRLMVGMALVFLAGAAFALPHLREKSIRKGPHQVAAAMAGPVPPPASVAPNNPPVVAPLPVVAVLPAPSVALAIPAHLPSSDDKTPVGLHTGIERSSRRIPSMPPLSKPVPGASVPLKSDPPVPTPAVEPTAVANPIAESYALVHEAQQAWVRQHFALAIDRARSALALSPDLPLAYQIITLCSCALHRAEDAKLASVHLDPAKRNLVRTLCEKDGVVLDPE